MTTALTLVVLVCFAYLLLVNLVAVAFLVIGAFENAVRKHDAESNDFATLESSRFTIPVSVIVAAYDEEVVIESSVRSLLELDYPEFEVWSSTTARPTRRSRVCSEAFELVPYEMFVRHIFTTQPVRAHLPEPAPPEPRRRRQGERREGRLAGMPRSTSLAIATSAVSTRTRCSIRRRC